MIGSILKGQKVILRPMKVSEAKNYLVWFKDPKVSRFLSSDNISLTLSEEKKYIQGVRKSKEKIPWSIYLREGNVHIGSTSLMNVDKKNKKAEWGIVIGRKEFWGQRLADDVVKLILKYAFSKLKLNRVELGVYVKHKGGIRCYKRCGFKHEGIKRKSFYRKVCRKVFEICINNDICWVFTVIKWEGLCYFIFI